MKKRVSWFALGAAVLLLLGAAVPRITVRTDSDGVLATPTEFWTANSSAINEVVNTVGISDTIAALDTATPKFGEDNALAISFRDMTITGPVGRTETLLETTTPEIDWDTDVDLTINVDDTITWSQTGTPKVGQTITINLVNAEAYNVESNWEGLTGWVWQRKPTIIPAGSRVTVFVTYKASGIYDATYDGPQDTWTTPEGGTGRTTHPSGYVLVGDGPNAVGAAAIGSGLQLTGSGQNRVLSVPLAGSTSAEREITVALAGSNQYTNTTVLNADEFVAMRANVVFASPGGNSAFIQTYAGFEYEDGESIVVDTNQVKVPSDTALWAGWTLGHTDNKYPVLKVGGLDGVTGILAVNDLRVTVLDLLEAATPDPWAGYVFTESFEGTGAENEDTDPSGTISFDATDYYFGSGSQSAKYDNEASAAARTFLLPSTYNSVSGRFSLRASASPNAETRVFVLRDSSGTQVMAISITTGRQVKVYSGAASITSTSGFSSGQWITIYYEYRKGTGANGIARAGWSNDGTKTSNSDNIAERTTTPDTAQIASVGIRSDSRNWISWWDAIVVHPTFTWAELPAGLPSGM